MPPHFNPRAPRGARPWQRPSHGCMTNFNPRAPRGARRNHRHRRRAVPHFNPRAPRGARPVSMFYMFPANLFQSTRPAWGATSAPGMLSRRIAISIHAPRVGRDSRKSSAQLQEHTFQSTRPAWGATASLAASPWCLAFQSTRPAWGATWAIFKWYEIPTFQSTRPAWGATVPVYTGLIAAVTLYFSRTSFLACCYRHFSSQSPLCDTGSHRDFAAILAKEMPATASEFLQLHNLVLHRRAAFFLRIYFPSYKNAGCLFLGQSNLSTHAAGRRTVLHRERIQTRSSARAVRGARSISPLFSSVCGRQVFPY